MICEMCKVTDNSVEKFIYEGHLTMYQAPEISYSLVYQMHPECVVSDKLRRVNG